MFGRRCFFFFGLFHCISLYHAQHFGELGVTRYYNVNGEVIDDEDDTFCYYEYGTRTERIFDLWAVPFLFCFLFLFRLFLCLTRLIILSWLAAAVPMYSNASFILSLVVAGGEILRDLLPTKGLARSQKILPGKEKTFCSRATTLTLVYCHLPPPPSHQQRETHLLFHLCARCLYFCCCTLSMNKHRSCSRWTHKKKWCFFPEQKYIHIHTHTRWRMKE